MSNVMFDVLSILFDQETNECSSEIEVTFPLLRKRETWKLIYTHDQLVTIIAERKDVEIVFNLTNSPFKSLLFESEKESLSVCPNFEQGVLSGILINEKGENDPWIFHI